MANPHSTKPTRSEAAAETATHAAPAAWMSEGAGDHYAARSRGDAENPSVPHASLPFVADCGAQEVRATVGSSDGEAMLQS
jgi:hypothetical protein